MNSWLCTTSGTRHIQTVFESMSTTLFKLLFSDPENGYFAGALRRNHRYSRKDVSRLLRLESDQSGTLNGYKIDSHSQTIPIFVNYRKHKGLAPRIAYEDEFIDHSTMRWFTRSNRTLKSQEVQSSSNINSLSICLYAGMIYQMKDSPTLAKPLQVIPSKQK